MINNVVVHLWVDHLRTLALRHCQTDLGAADVKLWCMAGKTHMARIELPVDLSGGRVIVAGTRIDDEMEIAQNLVPSTPTVEDQPVVGSDDQVYLVIGLLLLEGMQRVDRIVGTWQLILDAAYTQALMATDGEFEHLLPVGIRGKRLRRGSLQRVQRAANEPHLIDETLTHQIVAEGYVSRMHRIETAAVDADSH